MHRPDDPPANGWPHRAASGDDLLPPVEPPAAGFILKLFVIPALIVVVLLAMWQVPRWLLRRTSADPRELIARLDEGSRIARFQAAFDLAQRLADDRYREFRQSPEVATELAEILKQEVERGSGAGGMDDAEIQFRRYLAQALGKFEVQEGTDALLLAARTNRDPRERVVRDGAVQAIAERAFQLHHRTPPAELVQPELQATLAQLARDDDPIIRVQTAFALGAIGTPWAIEQLEVLTGDPYADTRFNAAVALAHRGNAKGVDTLAEMLELEDLASVQEETNDQARANKRAIIVSNAIQATQELLRQNPQADLSPVLAALERLASADRAALAKARIPTGAVAEARRVLELRQERK